MKLFKKVILPFAISSMLFLSACSSSNGTSAQSTAIETTSAISEVSSVTTTLTEQSTDISEQTTITTSEGTSIVSSKPKEPLNNQLDTGNWHKTLPFLLIKSFLKKN